MPSASPGRVAFRTAIACHGWDGVRSHTPSVPRRSRRRPVRLRSTLVSVTHLVDRDPVIGPDELITGLVPPPRFDAVRFADLPARTRPSRASRRR